MAAVMEAIFVPPPVEAFAARTGLLPYLPAVLDVTRRHYPTQLVRVELLDDPEIEDYERVGVFVEVGGTAARAEVLARVEAWNEWVDALLDVVPSIYSVYLVPGIR